MIQIWPWTKESYVEWNGMRIMILLVWWDVSDWRFQMTWKLTSSVTGWNFINYCLFWFCLKILNNFKILSHFHIERISQQDWLFVVKHMLESWSSWDCGERRNPSSAMSPRIGKCRHREMKFLCHSCVWFDRNLYVISVNKFLIIYFKLKSWLKKSKNFMSSHWLIFVRIENIC